MSWVREAVDGLLMGRTVKVRPLGGSMRGRIISGQWVTLVPATIHDVAVDDVILVRWKGNYLLHLAKQVEDARVLIGNNLGKTNGWVSASDVLGKVVAVQD